jgi:hypothetical protein
MRSPDKQRIAGWLSGCAPRALRHGRSPHVFAAAAVAGVMACLLCCQVDAAIQSAWISFAPYAGNGRYYLWNSDTHQIVQLTDGTTRGDILCAFSPDGKKLAYIGDGNGKRGVYTVNNDGTEITRICATFTTDGGLFCNICWTQKGLFWSENQRSIYWADPVTKQNKSIGSLTTNTTGNHLRMSRDGARAYLRTDHETAAGVGGLFFEVSSSTTLINERVTPAWDHGSCMLNDGSAAIWVKPGSHKYFEIRDFVDLTKYTALALYDNLDASYELAGPGFGPYTTPNNDSLIMYRMDDHDNPTWSDPRFFIFNIYTHELKAATPSDANIAPGGPISTLGQYYDAGEFWMGALPDPHSSVGAQATGVDGASVGPTRLTSVGHTASGDLRVSYSLGAVASSDARIEVYSLDGTRIAVQRLMPRVGEAEAVVALPVTTDALIARIRTGAGPGATMATYQTR